LVKVIFVGTGSGKTSLNRFHSSILISTHNTNLLIDAGDGISKAMLSHGIEYNLISGIFFTHLHPDHSAGLPSLITQMKLNNRVNDLFIYADPGLFKFLESFVANSYLYKERLGFKINYIPAKQNKTVYINETINILSRQNSHLDSVKDYIDSSQTISSSSVLISAENKRIHYTSDIGGIADLLLYDEYDIDLVICELTHIQPDDLKKYFTSNTKYKKIIFSHISEDDLAIYEKTIAGFPLEISSNISIAEDGLEIKL